MATYNSSQSGNFSSSATWGGADATEGFWIKDFQINIDKPYTIPPFNLVNNQNAFSPVPTQVKLSFSEQKIRLSARII